MVRLARPATAVKIPHEAAERRQLAHGAEANVPPPPAHPAGSRTRNTLPAPGEVTRDLLALD
jgi:hypothetical protein